MNSGQDFKRRELQHLALGISFRSFESFMGEQKKEKEKWSCFRKESIINQACIFQWLLKKPNVTHPSCSNLYLIWTCNTEGRNQWIIFKKRFLMNWAGQNVWGKDVSFQNSMFAISFPHFLTVVTWVNCICPQLLANDNQITKLQSTLKTRYGHQTGAIIIYKYMLQNSVSRLTKAETICNHFDSRFSLSVIL